MRALIFLSCLGCFLSVLPLCAEVDQPAEDQGTSQVAVDGAAMNEPQQNLATPSLTSDASADSAAIENAFAGRGLSLTLDSTSSLGNYKFPVAIELPMLPWVRVDPKVTRYRVLDPRRYRFSVKYDPLVVQRPAGHLTGLSSAAERKGSLVISDQLKGELVGDDKHPPHELNLKAKAGYDWDTRDGKPSSLDAALDASKIWLTSLDLDLNASLGETWYTRTSTASPYTKLNSKLSLATDILPKKLDNRVSLSAELSRDDYSGPGFAGIDNVTDKSRHTDYNLKEVLQYNILKNKDQATGHVIRISFTEAHVGTRDHDLVLGAELGINLTWPYNSSWSGLVRSAHGLR